MNKSLIENLFQWPKPFITGTDLRVLVDGTEDSRKGIIKRAVKEGYLQRIKQNLFLIKHFPNRPLPDRFELAEIIYGPSHISFESALSFHGWIPEAVQTTCSSTVKPSKEFHTPLGVFSYEKIPARVFPIGIQYVLNQDSSCYFVAEPWRAIADMVYTRKKSWPGLQGLSEDMRIELDILLSSDAKLLSVLADDYSSKRTQKVLSKLLKEITQR